MREIRIYQPGDYETGASIELSATGAQHVAVVLRMQVGEQLTLFNGKNQAFPSTIAAIKKNTVTVIVGPLQTMTRESPLLIHLAQAISKGERMELAIQKSVELGVNCITPVITERCVVKLDRERMAKKHQQWQSIAVAACEQSGRNYVPVVHAPVPFDQVVQTMQGVLRLILHPATQSTWRDYVPFQGDIALLIGPEGGFSEAELCFAEKCGFAPLSLGPRVLRTETAAISALSVLQAIGGDL